MNTKHVVLGDTHGAHALESPTWYGLGNTELEAIADAHQNCAQLPDNSKPYLCTTDLDLDQYQDGEVIFELLSPGVVTASLNKLRVSA